MTQDQMRPKIIAMTRDVVEQAGIKLTGSTYLTWDNCNDDNSPPYRATVTGGFRGQPTLAESEAEVDRWIAALEKHGWSRQSPAKSSVSRYLTGPEDFAVTIVPHLDPELQPGADFVVSSACSLTEDLKDANAENLTKQLS